MKMDGFFILDAKKTKQAKKMQMTRVHHRGGESNLTTATGRSATYATLAAVGNLRLSITYDTNIFFGSVATGGSSPCRRSFNGTAAPWSAFGGLQNHHK
jgi:hypothetical protein